MTLKNHIRDMEIEFDEKFPDTKLGIHPEYGVKVYRSDLIKSFLKSSPISLLEKVVEMIEGEKCEVPKNPIFNLNGREVINVETVDECLKYAGRFNYNKALDDLKEKLSEEIKELK